MSRPSDSWICLQVDQRDWRGMVARLTDTTQDWHIESGGGILHLLLPTERSPVTPWLLLSSSHMRLCREGMLGTLRTQCSGPEREEWVQYFTCSYFRIDDNQIKSLHLRLQETHDVLSAALFTQAAKASIRSLQPSAPFSTTLETTTKTCSYRRPSTFESLLAISGALSVVGNEG